MLEAVWLKNGKEVEWVDPVLGLNGSDATDISSIRVWNGCDWYGFDGDVDEFIVRVAQREVE